ncbi:MAG: hypothetical protein GY727_13790 [Gammaproteobacteria bacterium]|nr:hypothetical protein [Gammaproteobacteria bacterium]MCP4089825.1 hypothetical protein [Gammaproteobacteria bacterium]MCP4275349.1 hypothetical protein [Gammaproteobacteria bacterium]MCP4831240.1 hypothetical protein [Gammaproteobacteria bacterium]MCP4927651.1 hypothetical protein [Gammaproteobacteria bacterium]
MNRWLRRLGWVIALMVVFSATLEVYMRWPSTAELSPLGLDEDTRYLLLLVHGSGGSKEPTFIEMEQRLNEAFADDPQVAVVRLVWAPHDNRRRSYVLGHRLGTAIGRELAMLPELTDIRLVAHSAGAYFLDPICVAYRNQVDPDVRTFIEMTFLDGIGIAGGWDYDWGYRNHGHCADFARSIYTTNDWAPGHNEPYDYAHNIDVTESLARRTFDRPGHYYPIRYFLSHLVSEQQPRQRSHMNLPRGAVHVAED